MALRGLLWREGKINADYDRQRIRFLWADQVWARLLKLQWPDFDFT
jgi:hypothetical protein